MAWIVVDAVFAVFERASDVFRMLLLNCSVARMDDKDRGKSIFLRTFEVIFFLSEISPVLLLDARVEGMQR